METIVYGTEIDFCQRLDESLDLILRQELGARETVELLLHVRDDLLGFSVRMDTTHLTVCSTTLGVLATHGLELLEVLGLDLIQTGLIGLANVLNFLDRLIRRSEEHTSELQSH